MVLKFWKEQKLKNNNNIQMSERGFRSSVTIRQVVCSILIPHWGQFDCKVRVVCFRVFGRIKATFYFNKDEVGKQGGEAEQ